ncbi:hypothetical protein ACIRL0_05270 [Streptomyces sp. NPDC102365]|uniref:hypothetical protein n=1 Tax=Streptomyces sp. NPDC102365 TaxID=3366162 RepID=UPI0037FE8FD3
MNLRVLRTELRRSVAPWAGVVVLVPSLAFLYLVDAAWWRDTTAWTAQWTPMAMWTRSLLYYLWPLAVGLGALQGLRDHRSKMYELLTSTPRPARHRAAVLTGTTALTLTTAFALLVLVGAVQVWGNTGYTHAGWLPISLVGAFFLVAGATLGMGAGRALPSALTPPALAMTAFVFTVLMHASLGRTETATSSGIPLTEPNQVSLLSPTVEEVRDALLTLSASVHLGQTVWLLGMATTGFVLLIASTRAARLIAVTPLLAGGVAALLVLPSDPARMYVVDKAAAEPVCAGPVCVTTTQRARLDGLAGPGKEALRLLHTALGDRAPVSVRENAAVLPWGSTPRWSRESVLFEFDDAMISGVTGEKLTRALIAQAMVPMCVPTGWSGTAADPAAQSVAVAWVTGDLEPLAGTGFSAAEQTAAARPVWQDLKALPQDEQLARISAMRTTALSCEGDPLAALKGGASR